MNDGINFFWIGSDIYLASELDELSYCIGLWLSKEELLILKNDEAVKGDGSISLEVASD